MNRNRPEQLEEVVGQLCDKLTGSNKEQLRDVASLGLKTVVAGECTGWAGEQEGRGVQYNRWLRPQESCDLSCTSDCAGSRQAGVQQAAMCHCTQHGRPLCMPMARALFSKPTSPPRCFTPCQLPCCRAEP